MLDRRRFVAATVTAPLLGCMPVRSSAPGDSSPWCCARTRSWNVDEAVSFHSQAHALVAVEPHSCIMALATGTPMIHFFTRQHGTKAFMFRDIGLPEWLVDIDVEPAARVSLELNRIHDDYDRARAKARRAMQFVNDRSAEMAAVIRDVLVSR